MIRFKLSSILEQQRMTQAELARLTKIRPSTICDIYNNNADFIKIEHLNSICRVLECEISDMLLIVQDD